jgi:aspartyl-tRNA(Asn)/glutamyl-tRNA(Gln) amidotransferase subunit A
MSAATVERGVTCRERVETALAAIDDVQPRLNAFTSIRAEAALAEADALDRAHGRQPRGPLHGLPVVVKDLFDVAGLATTGACAAYRDRRAPTDAAVVAALRRAGAVVVAKTNQHELGAGATGLVSCFGATVNPHDPDRITGGSSSGSAAAVAAGVVPLAIGSDTGGSIRMPASFCGITGLRPTPGRVSLQGAQAMSPGFDTAGPMAATARECAVVFAALTGAPAPPPAAPGVARGLRVGLPRPYFQRLHRDTRTAVESVAGALEALGAHVDWLDRPDIDHDFDGFRHVWADLAHHHRDLWDNPEVSDEVGALIDVGRSLSGVAYAHSRACARQMRDQFTLALSTVDVLLTPTTPYPAPRRDELEVAVDGGALDVHRGGPSRLTVPVNEAGVPAVAFPAGTTANGLPIGAQLIGRPHRDERLLDVVAALQDGSAPID